MSTTAVVAEIVVVGLEAAAWMTALLLVIFGRGWVDLDTLAQFNAVILLLVVAAAYGLGVIVDRLADSAFKRLEKTAVGRYLNRWFGKKSGKEKLPAKVREMRFKVAKTDDGVAKFLDYQRSRLRVARGTALNLLLATPVALVYLLRYGETAQALWAVALLLALLVVTVAVAERIRGAWVARLRDAYLMLEEKGTTS